MSAAELLLAAAGEVREANQAELAEAAANAAYLLGVLRQVGTGLGHAPPQQVLVGLQGMRLWSLQLRELGKPRGHRVGGEVAALLLRRRPSHGTTTPAGQGSNERGQVALTPMPESMNSFLGPTCWWRPWPAAGSCSCPWGCSW